jgi:lysophospholipase L1-like esterase
MKNLSTGLVLAGLLLAGLNAQVSMSGKGSISGAASVKTVPTQPIVIGCVGDSITYGYLSSGGRVSPDPCAQMASDLNTMTGTSLYSSFNVGVIGSFSANWITGCTSCLPGGGGNITSALTGLSPTRFTPGLVAAGVSLVQIMIGTNDAQTPVSQSAYQGNLTNIITAIKSAGINKIVLHYQPYINTNLGGWTISIADPALLTYQTAMKNVAAADPTHVLIGDTTAYGWFQANPTYQSDGVHPSSAGYLALAQMWATALYADLGL